MIEVPRPLTENLPKYYGDRGREWLADLPRMLDARNLQNTLWNVEDGEYAIDPAQRLIADTIVNRPQRTLSGPARP
jgi:hypothetical protein